MIQLASQPPSAEAIVRDAAGRLIRIREALEDGEFDLAYAIVAAVEMEIVGWTEREAA